MKLNYSIGIATKMIFIVTFIVVSAIGVVVYIATDLFQEDSITRVQEINKDTAAQMAERVLGVFQDATEKMTLMAQFATKSATPEEAKRAIDNTLLGNDDLISFLAYKFNENSEPELQYFSVNEPAMAEFNLDLKKVETGVYTELLNQHKKKPQELVLLNSSPIYKVPLFTISFLSTGTQTENKDSLVGRWWFRAEIRQDRILKVFASRKSILSYLVDARGRLMAHSEAQENPAMREAVIASKSFVTNPIVQKMLETESDNHQMRYSDDSGEGYLGAFKKVGVAGIGVVAEVAESKALATIQRVQYRSLLVMVVVVCAAFILNFGFSQSLTSNLKKLFHATEQIVTGKFDVDLNVKSHDEIGALAKAFHNMTEGLKERDKIKGAFDKFHSKEIAKKLLSGEIKLGGERKHATVFFSDIRGFTKVSERMTPDQVVGMLNEYFNGMVKIIMSRHGVVDKYIGDAILAVWGVPESRANDAYSAVRASLEMRDFLVGFNKQRKARGKDEVKIGIGLHSGELLAGNIGSNERLEYTVIGDTVNQASRIEASTKMIGADILISETTYTLVQEDGIEVGPPIAINAKGKSKPLIVHQVIGYIDKKTQQLVTSLTEEEIEKIRNGANDFIEQEEAKTSIARAPVAPRSFERPQVIPPPAPQHPRVNPEYFNKAYNNEEGVLMRPKEDMTAEVWYVVHDPGSKEYQGPFSLNQIAMKLHSKQYDYNTAYAFKMGDSQMTPVNQIPELNRRSDQSSGIQRDLPETAIRKQSQTDEWYVAGPNGETLGPYTEDDLRVALGKGNITRTTYVWNKSLPNWIFLHQVPGFDRRDAS